MLLVEICDSHANHDCLHTMTAETTTNPSVSAAAMRVEDLDQIIAASNQLTQRLQSSHQRLQDEVVRLRQQLASADEQLQRSRRLAALGEMATGIAHEIRNPLAAIALYTGMIVQDLDREAGPDQQTRHYAATMASAIDGLESIVRDVLTFAREIKPEITTCRFGQILDTVMSTASMAIRENNITLVTNNQDNDLCFQVDRQLLQQALMNLIQNAIQAMSRQPDNLQRKITVATTTRDQHIIIQIRDSGPGIDHACINRIFNPFFTTRNTGTGLGLAIVHRIIDAHHGSIRAHNDDGAVFEISLPIVMEPHAQS